MELVPAKRFHISFFGMLQVEMSSGLASAFSKRMLPCFQFVPSGLVASVAVCGNEETCESMVGQNRRVHLFKVDNSTTRPAQLSAHSNLVRP